MITKAFTPRMGVKAFVIMMWARDAGGGSGGKCEMPGQ
jgi:hypothetical protein